MAFKDLPDNASVFSSTPTSYILRLCPFESILLRGYGNGIDVAFLEVRDSRRPTNAYLIKGSLPVDHKCLLGVESFEYLGYLLGQLRAIDAKDLDRCCCRVGERSKQGKDGAESDLLSYFSGVSHGTIESRTVEKADPHLLYTLFHTSVVDIQVHAQRLKHRGTPAKT